MIEQKRKAAMDIADTIKDEINKMYTIGGIDELDSTALDAIKNIEELRKMLHADLTDSGLQVGDILKYDDELDDDTALEYMITRIDPNGVAYAICSDGSVLQDVDYDNMVKTGKHFDRIVIDLAGSGMIWW